MFRMDPTTQAFAYLALARAIERIIIVIAGMRCLWLGYMLFLAGINGQAGFEAQHNKTRVRLLKAAPGLFFALFGAIILVVAITKGFNASQPSSQDPVVKTLHYYPVNQLESDHGTHVAAILRTPKTP